MNLRKMRVEKLQQINCTIVLVCVSKDPPETCAHFLTFHKVGVKYKLLFSTNLEICFDVVSHKFFSHWLGPFIDTKPKCLKKQYLAIYDGGYEGS